MAADALSQQLNEAGMHTGPQGRSYRGQDSKVCQPAWDSGPVAGSGPAAAVRAGNRAHRTKKKIRCRIGAALWRDPTVETIILAFPP
jgi:hypothetical protein